MLENAVEATDCPLSSKKRKFPRHHIALATLHTGSSNDDLDDLLDELDDESAEEEEDSAEADSDVEDSDNKDSISISTQVAVNVEAVPNMLKPLSSFPLGSYNVFEPNFESYGLSGVKTTLG